MIAPWYAIFYSKLERIAQRYGWCLSIHGSMQRDLDIILIPWTDDAESEETVLDAFDKFIKGSQYYKRTHKNMLGFHAEEKSHGRKAYSIYIGMYGHYLDISTIPRIIKNKDINVSDEQATEYLQHIEKENA